MGVEAPVHVARRRVEAVEMSVVRADVDAQLPNGRRRVHVASRAVRPPQLARGRAVGVHLVVGRADVDAPVRNGGRRVERPGRAEPCLRRRAPDLVPGKRVQRVDVVGLGSGKDEVGLATHAVEVKRLREHGTDEHRARKRRIEMKRSDGRLG